MARCEQRGNDYDNVQCFCCAHCAEKSGARQLRDRVG
jgi:hypothetical protein